jgi:hypothetical protein
MPGQYSTLMPALMTLKGQIMGELEANLPRLFSLNPSRREAIAQYLDRLAGIAPGPSASAGVADTAGGLRRWVEGPRSPAQNAALRAYFEEVALLVVGQAILLKSWSDRAVRVWTEADLGRLNWALSTTLKPHMPVDREGWQITRPNLYSWYNPGSTVRAQLWTTLENSRATAEGPGLLSSIMGPARQALPDVKHPHGYDARFFQAIWGSCAHFGNNPNEDSSPLRRTRMVFSPTLRDGTNLRTSPDNLIWVGLDSSPFSIMVAELMMLWWGPSAPPLWSLGTGLEAHSREQLSLGLASPKPSLINRISDMEACDFAFVLEENAVRTQGRSTDALRMREQLESLPYFKKLKAPLTTLGTLQACVSLSKLRPGGLLWWAREEPITSEEGQEALSFLLERARCIAEWDFSELGHQLPATAPLFPKYLYCFVREAQIEARLTHRPLRISLHGQVRSHIELPSMLEDALLSAVRPATEPLPPRGHWQIHCNVSPTPQKDWSERWPEPASQNVIRSLERLRVASLPLASATTIRHTPDGGPGQSHFWSVHASLKGFWIRPEVDESGRKLVALPLPHAGKEQKGSGMMVLVPDASWISPLCRYLESSCVREWLDHRAERRGDRWILNEQVVRWIPVPKLLLARLGGGGADVVSALNAEQVDRASQLPLDPRRLREELARWNLEEEALKEVRASVFIRAANALEDLQTSKRHLLAMISNTGEIRWRELLGVLPKGECMQASLHPRLQMRGQLPPHVPIDRIERVQMPAPGFLLSTESGFSLHISSDSQLLLDMLADQLNGMTHPTWNELARYLTLPRRLEAAEETAGDLLRSHGSVVLEARGLRELLSDCQFF